MPEVPIKKTSKNIVSLTNEEKATNTMTVDEATWSVDEAHSPSTVDSPKHVLSKVSKNRVTLTKTTPKKEQAEFDEDKFDSGKFA